MSQLSGLSSLDTIAEVQTTSTLVPRETAPTFSSERCSNIENSGQSEKSLSEFVQYSPTNPTGNQRNESLEIATSNFSKLHDPRPLVPKRSYRDLNDPTMQRYKMIMNNWLVYKRYVAEAGHGEAFRRTKHELGEKAATHLRANYHGLLGSSLKTEVT